jgi:hypothetical protein
MSSEYKIFKFVILLYLARTFINIYHIDFMGKIELSILTWFHSIINLNELIFDWYS